MEKVDFDNIDMGKVAVRKVFTRVNPITKKLEKSDKTIKLDELANTNKMYDDWKHTNPDEIISSWLDNVKKFSIKEFADKFINSMNGDQPTGSTAQFIGASKSGKTFTMIELINLFLNMSQWKNKLIIVIVTPNFHATAYDKLRSLHDKGKIMVIENVAQLPKLIKILFSINKHCDLYYKPVIFIDDVISKNMQSSVIEDLYLIKRNMNISTIMGTQEDTIGSKKGRNNANYLLFKRINNDVEILEIIEKYLRSKFPPLNRGDKIKNVELYKALIGDYNSMLLDNLDDEFYHVPKNSKKSKSKE
jgi:hypothetical protein